MGMAGSSWCMREGKWSGELVLSMIVEGSEIGASERL